MALSSPNCSPGSRSWALFDDWLRTSAGVWRPWTTIAKIDYIDSEENDLPYERQATFSFLAKDDKEIVQGILSYDSWDAQHDLGDVYTDFSDEGKIFCERIIEDGARVFLKLEESIGKFPSRWLIWPTFIHYFCLREDENGNFIDPYNLEKVIDIPFPATSGPVLLRTDYLQDYLCAREMVLIRQHDHRRFWDEPLTELSEDDLGIIVKKEWGCYRLDINNQGIGVGKCFSRIVAKDLVPPFKKAGNVGGEHQSSNLPKEYPEFIIDKDLDGQIKMGKPDAEKILVPAFFDPKVLKRYYDQPDIYSVGFDSPGLGGVSYLDQWSMPIGRTSENQIVIWLGDLAKQGLSRQEVSHWHSFNVPPRGGHANDFWKAQMECEPPDSPSIERRLKDTRAALAKELASNGASVFKKYAGPDKNLEKMLRVPLYDDHNELRETAFLLSKIFVEYLNVGIFQSDLDEKHRIDNAGENLGQIVLFSNWLEYEKRVPKKIAVSVKKALQNVQMLRSKIGAAHRFSDSSYHEVIDRLELKKNVSASSIFSAVAVPLADSLENLCVHLKCDNKCWWLQKRNKP